MADNRELTALLARDAYREGEFELSSGRASSYYLDAKQVTYSPRGAQLVGEAVLAAIREFDVEAVGGLTLGADAIVASTVVASAGTANPIPGFIVRKQAKEHGLERGIEGVSPAGKRVAIVDDVITSGGSALLAVDAAKAAGATVAVVVALVDREEGGVDNITEAGVAFRAICSVTDVREAGNPALA